MRETLRGIAFASTLFTVACSNGQATSAPATRTEGEKPATSIAAVPLSGRVTDAAHILSPKAQATLSDRLAKLEQKTQHQLVVVTVPSLDGHDIANYTRDLANSWGIGRKGYNDGAVLLIAPKERKVRIAVGYGLEKRLPDRACQQIIEQKILPSFRKGDLPGGIGAGTDALIARLE